MDLRRQTSYSLAAGSPPHGALSLNSGLSDLSHDPGRSWLSVLIWILCRDAWRRSMTKWLPPRDEEHAAGPPPPPGPVHIGRRHAHTPPHVHIYAGLEHVSHQIADVGSQMRDVLLEVEELKRIVKELVARADGNE